MTPGTEQDSAQPAAGQTEPSWAQPGTQPVLQPAAAGCPCVPKAWLGAEGIPDLVPAPPLLGWGLRASCRLPRSPAAEPIVPLSGPGSTSPAQGSPCAQGEATLATPNPSAYPLTQPTAPPGEARAQGSSSPAQSQPDCI